MQPSPSPSSSSHPPSPHPPPHPPQSQRQALESKGTSPAKRGHSAKRGTGIERSQSSTWESGEESRNKLVKAASTSKLLAKVVKNADKHKDPVISQAKMSTREKNSQAGKLTTESES
ncbi:unnamed protein product [Oncorhynchus mykiss]|uniref:Uncharacterized protein n=1 Tax=Oncorhynchus mykiss TaxID=8022 RepID=A0A060YYF0_ONCMY|nr:unnamed protein product [Oncorhynchus mykiss]